MERRGLSKHTVAPKHGEPIGLLRHVLRELQAEARDVFDSSGESVDRFLRERRDEALREFSVPA